MLSKAFRSCQAAASGYFVKQPSGILKVIAAAMPAESPSLRKMGSKDVTLGGDSGLPVSRARGAVSRTSPTGAAIGATSSALALAGAVSSGCGVVLAEASKTSAAAAAAAASTVTASTSSASALIAGGNTGAATAVTATSVSVSGPIASFLSVFPPLCFGFLQVSGLKTVKMIKERGTTGDLSPLQFVSLAGNCVVWVLYGMLRGDMTVLLPNLSGLLFGVYYTSVYAKYSPEPITKYLFGASAVTAAVICMALTLPSATAATCIGLTGSALAVLVMSAPLATMATVVKTKNTSAMPFATSLATFFNAASWTGYGALVAHDPLIYGPNALGLVAACVQMGLFARYGIHTEPFTSKEVEFPDADDASDKSV